MELLQELVMLVKKKPQGRQLWKDFVLDEVSIFVFRFGLLWADCLSVCFRLLRLLSASVHLAAIILKGCSKAAIPSPLTLLMKKLSKIT
jgi:hypothetical protein